MGKNLSRESKWGKRREGRLGEGGLLGGRRLGESGTWRCPRPFPPRAPVKKKEKHSPTQGLVYTENCKNPREHQVYTELWYTPMSKNLDQKKLFLHRFALACAGEPCEGLVPSWGPWDAPKRRWELSRRPLPPPPFRRV